MDQKSEWPTNSNSLAFDRGTQAVLSSTGIKINSLRNALLRDAQSLFGTSSPFLKPDAKSLFGTSAVALHRPVDSILYF